MGNNKNKAFYLRQSLFEVGVNNRFVAVMLSLLLLVVASACSENVDNVAEEGVSKKAENGTTLYLKITDANDALVRNLAQETTVSVVATLKSPTDEPIEGQVVRFSTDMGMLAAQTGLTNAAGRAIVSFASGVMPGAGEIIATVDVDGADLSVSFGFEVGGAPPTAPEPPPVQIIQSQSNDGAMVFVSADPQQITLKSTGGAGWSELSTVTFQLTGADGLPFVGKTVNFSISNEVGGVSLEPLSAETDVDGIVSTVVQAGTVPTSVVVSASAAVGEGDATSVVTSVSSTLAVGVGLPDSDSMSLSLSNLAPEAWNRDGEEVEVTVRLADHFNNYVVDGTTIYFVAEGGVIEPSCETVDSACSVRWVAQNPKPVDHRASILATTIGSESFPYVDGNGIYNLVDGEPFADLNGNKVFDGDDTFTDLNGNSSFDGPGFVDLGESFLDANENGLRDADEFFVDSNANGEYDVAGDGKFNGLLCDPASNACADDKTVQISTSGVIVMASSFARYAVENKDADLVYLSTIPSISVNAPRAVVEADSEITRLTIYYSDSAGQVMPAGTVISVSSSVGQIIGSVPTEVMSRLDGDGVGTFDLRIKDTDLTEIESGVIEIRFTTPSGNVTYILLEALI